MASKVKVSKAEYADALKNWTAEKAGEAIEALINKKKGKNYMADVKQLAVDSQL